VGICDCRFANPFWIHKVCIPGLEINAAKVYGVKTLMEITSNIVLVRSFSVQRQKTKHEFVESQFIIT